MANITTVTPLVSWFLREQPVSSKFNSELKDKVNILITNHVVINNGLEELLQGSVGGSQQAKLSFGLSAAPTGWTRDTSFNDDQVLRVTDGSTLPPNPPGSSPTAVGGAQGGQDDNKIVGFSSSNEGAHTHTLANHTHTLGNHTHTITNHVHGVGGHKHSPGAHSGHSVPGAVQPHGGPSATVVLANGVGTSADTGIAGSDHTHPNQALHTHTITGTQTVFGPGGGVSSTGTATGNPTSLPSSGGSGGTPNTGPSTNTSSNTGDHNHPVSNDGTWRPQYLNILLCKKD